MYEGRECYFQKIVLYTSLNEGVSWIKWPALHAEEVEIFLTRQIPYSIHLCCAPMHHDWELTPWIKGMNQWKKFKLASNEDLSGHFEQIRHLLISRTLSFIDILFLYIFFCIYFISVRYS